MEFENTEIEDAVITAMHDEDLHTYAAIANEIDEDAAKVYDTLNGLCRRNIVYRVKDTQDYYLAGVEPMQTVEDEPEEDVILELGKPEPPPAAKAEPQTKPRKRRGPYSRSKNKVDLEKIEEFAALGLSHNQIADELGIVRTTYYNYRRDGDALAENINAAYKKGQRRAMQQEDAIAGPKTAAPANAAPCSAVEQSGVARVGASKAVETAESLKTQKEVEESIPIRVARPAHPLECEIGESIGANIHKGTAFPEPGNWSTGDASRKPADGSNGKCEHSIAYNSQYPAIASENINMPNGTVLIVVHGNLFSASKLERDFIEGLIEVVDAFKSRQNRRGEMHARNLTRG